MVPSSWAGRVFDWKARCNTDPGSSPRCGKGFLPLESTSSADSLVVLQLHWCAIASINICVHVKNSKTLAAILLFGRTKILHSPIGMASAALATALPCPGKATRISHKGQWSTLILKQTFNLSREAAVTWDYCCSVDATRTARDTTTDHPNITRPMIVSHAWVSKELVILLGFNVLSTTLGHLGTIKLRS